MCGICGIYHKRRGEVKKEEIEKMKRVMVHRGPDEEGTYLEGRVGLGFQRLKIIDLFRGRQPMFNEDGRIRAVFNGEIYNYLTLREELKKKGHVFFSNSDTEVLVHLYEEKGFECVKDLRGMFSFVIWDSRKRLLFGARDRFGIKPFYYYDGPREFVFASELKSILTLPGLQKEIDQESLAHYFTFQYVPEPATILKSIKKLPPASFFILKDDSFKIKKYWEVRFNPEDKPLSYFLEGIREKLRESVRLHTQSDVPWGGFLSGGIDSSIIASLLKEIGDVSTFSVGYREKGYSELEEARRTADFLKIKHNQYFISPGEFMEHLPRLVWHFDEPVADPAAISLYFVAREAKKKITVSLSGEGADEVFGGYGIYGEPQSLQYFRCLPANIQKYLSHLTQLFPEGTPGKNYVVRAKKKLQDRYAGNAFIFGDLEKKELLGEGLSLPSFKEVTRRYYESLFKSLDEVTAMQYIDLHTWLQGDILAKADKMTMANSLELRVPYLDHHLFEFAATIPTRYKIKGNKTKYALREAFKDLLPGEVINRPKRGFPVPTRRWLREELKEPVEKILKECFTPEYLNYSYVEGLFKKHQTGRVDYSRKIWTVLIFLLWHDIFIKGRIP